MLTTAARMAAIKPSATAAVAAKVKQLKAQNRDIISLSIGVPGFLPPDYVYEAAQKALENDSGNYLPVRGLPVLINAYQQRLAADGFEYKPEEICITMGGKNALYNLLQILTEQGDDVVFPAPYWVSYPEIALLAGARPVAVYAGTKTDYKVTAEQLDKAINSGTKAFIFNNPCNPTGAVYTKQEVAALAEVLKKHPKVWIISDDIYDKLIYDGQAFHHLLHVAPELRERLFIIQSVSKTYGMPGWRIGMAAGPAEVIQKMEMLVSQSLMNIPASTQAGAAAALTGPLDFLASYKQQFVRNRDYVLKELYDIPGFVCPRTSGAFYLFPQIKTFIGKKAKSGKTLMTDVDFCEELLEEQGVALVPGSPSGDSWAVRISYATEHATLVEAIKRLRTFVQNLS